MKYAKIGGQAVIEGIMMRYGDEYSIAVRKPDNEIELKKDTRVSLAKRAKVNRIPFLRGIFSFIDSLVLGMSTLSWSAEFYDEEEKKQVSEKKEKAMMGLTVFISIVLAVGIFILAPYFLSRLFKDLVKSDIWLAVIEGAIRITIFLLYIVLITLIKDIKRVFMYHGAEHKTITCIEKGMTLTPDNAASCSRFHCRCGTSFMVLVIIISVIFFIFIRVDNALLRVLIRLLLIPVIAGLSFEIIQWTGRHDNVLSRILSAPGLWIQRITTKEPDRDMLEVAIAAIEAVYDWKGFQKEAGLITDENA